MSLEKCACIDTLYTELPWEERFAAAKQDGFAAVEFWDWRTRNLEKTKALAEAAGMKILGFNGDADYSLINPSHKKKYLEELQKSLEAAQKVGAFSLTIHSNALGENGIVVNSYDELSDTVKLCSMYGTLLECVKLAKEKNIRLNLEALNVFTDHKGNFLKNTQMTAEICQLIRSPYLKILYDVYHMQINEGNLCKHIKDFCNQFGHVHIADVPGRHEPGTGEINFSNVISCLEECGYNGMLGYELFPKTNTKTAIKAIRSI